MAKKSVLFVCMGNICRSPMAEAVFIDLLMKKKQTHDWSVDSAAICDYHIGQKSNKRALEVLQKHGITNYDHTVRQIIPEDFEKFDFIFGMDDQNMEDLNELSRTAGAKKKSVLKLLASYDTDGDNIIHDPYYTKGLEAFETAYSKCVRSCDGFLKSFQK